ncbi:MAG: extracellular solute-binding protein [Candidatus Moranbacteria bacterium]|nr:extracellular solute-binding protein [Candidatus Moranbacteria bacterium]
MQSKIKILVAFIVLTSLFFFSGCLKKKETVYKVNLEIWGVFDNSDAYGKIAQAYREINPFVGEIKYRKFEADNYKRDLLDALASGQGPDIFFFHNTWLPSFADKVEPAPDWLLGEQEFRQNFVDVAANDFLDKSKVYAVPLSVDSLALYYNKDLFNAEGITSPPATWKELVEDVKRLTKIDQFGNIVQQGAALGTAYNINRSTDVLGLIMMQKGAQMINEDRTQAAFGYPVTVGEKSIQAGEEAFDFYTQFARSSSPQYGWNSRMHYSIDSFFEGTAAMMINYSWHYPTIKSKNSKLNFAVAPVPQFQGTPPVNYANYWGLAVAKNKIISSPSNPQLTGSEEVVPDNKVRIHEAWQFLKFLAIRNNGKITLVNGITGNSKEFPVSIDPVVEYLKETGNPAARRDIIEKQKSDPILGSFVYGNLIAKNWYQTEPEAIETILAEAIDSVNRGKMTVRDALELAETRVSQLMRK